MRKSSKWTERREKERQRSQRLFELLWGCLSAPALPPPLSGSTLKFESRSVGLHWGRDGEEEEEGGRSVTLTFQPEHYTRKIIRQMLEDGQIPLTFLPWIVCLPFQALCLEGGGKLQCHDEYSRLHTRVKNKIIDVTEKLLHLFGNFSHKTRRRAAVKKGKKSHSGTAIIIKTYMQ